MSASIELSHVGRQFGAFALRDLSLTVGAGEYWVVLGPSGAGKSLLLQLVAGLIAPDQGRIAIAGSDATAVPPERRNIGMVFQQSALFPHLSVVDNIGYGLRHRGLDRAARDKRVSALVELLRLQPILARPVATLSGGEAQKVAIARALAIEPAALLLDEPLGPIDHNTRLELQAELRRLHGELKFTAVHVTHSRDEARALADHCAVLRDGALEQCGTVDTVFARPANEFVAHFLGAPAPMATAT